MFSLFLRNCINLGFSRNKTQTPAKTRKLYAGKIYRSALRSKRENQKMIQPALITDNLKSLSFNSETFSFLPL